jgi:hypothetical protein
LGIVAPRTVFKSCFNCNQNNTVKRLGPSRGENAKDWTGVIPRSVGNGYLTNDTDKDARIYRNEENGLYEIKKCNLAGIETIPKYGKYSKNVARQIPNKGNLRKMSRELFARMIIRQNASNLLFEGPELKKIFAQAYSN